MTLNKLIEKYMRLQKERYETITIQQVIIDLRQVRSIGNQPIKERRKNDNGRNGKKSRKSN